MARISHTLKNMNYPRVAYPYQIKGVKYGECLNTTVTGDVYFNVPYGCSELKDSTFYFALKWSLRFAPVYNLPKK